jgi:hypothetical protein
MEYMSPKFFHTIFKTFLMGHIVEHIILFNKHIENHLNDKNTKSVQNILSLLHIILHDKNVLGYIG